MKQEIKIDWQEKMQFEAKTGNHTLMLDASDEFGGEDRGMRPKPLMLIALAGCTGMDVISLLKKMRIAFSGLEIKVEGSLTNGVPSYYDAMHIIYIFKGKYLPLDKLEKIVDMSYEKYCGVAHMYKEIMPVTYEIRIEESLSDAG